MDEYEIVSLSEDINGEEVMAAFIKEFLGREPTIQGLGATPEELLSFYSPVVKECLKSGLSIGTKHKASGKLVGFRLNKALTPEDKTSFDGHADSAKNDKQAVLESMFAEIENAVDIFEKYNVQKVLELGFLFTDSDHGGKGLAKALVQRAEEIGVNNGFQLANVIASNVITQAIFNKRGYDTYYTYDLARNSHFDLSKTQGVKAWFMMAKKL